MNSEEIYAAVIERYSTLSSDTDKSRGVYSKSIAQSFGYTEEELDGIPGQSNLGLSCGNPLAIATLREGEIVIDLGSGAGFDVFLAARKVGRTGRAIGVDMNKDMLSLAENNKTISGTNNVEFVDARITNIPLADGIADVTISNCVINLVPEGERQLVFNEMFRLLKPGGRVAVSDILAKKVLPEKLRMCAAAYVGCVAGASSVSQYRTYLNQAGFADVLIKNANNDLNVYLDTLPDGTTRSNDAKGGDQKSTCCTSAATTSRACCSAETKASGCCGPESNESGCCTAPSKTGKGLDLAELAAELENIDLNDWVGSYNIFAVKAPASL